MSNCRSVPKLDTLILVKTMIKNHSFSNPFNSNNNNSGADGPGRSRFRNNGRSNSAPEVSFRDR